MDVGIGDSRELPQKLKTVLGNRSVSDPLPSLDWGALMLRALGFRTPTVGEARLLEGFVETNSADQAEISGSTVAMALGVDITLTRSTGAREEFRASNSGVAEKVDIFAIQKSKTFVAVVPTEARQGSVRAFIQTLWARKLQNQLTPEGEGPERLGTAVTHDKKRKELEKDSILILDDDGEEDRGKKRSSMQKIPILAELSEEAFKGFATEVQQYQREWRWSNSIAYNIKQKVERLWNMGQGVKWSEVDKETKVEFLSNLQEVIKRAAGQFRSERIMIEDPALRWSEGSIDWENLAEQIEERELEGQANCRAVTKMFKDTRYYTEVQREMSTIRKSDLDLADPLLISLSMAKRAVQVVDQEGRGAAGAGRGYGLQNSPKSWYDTHPENSGGKKFFLGRGNGAGMGTIMKGNGDLECYRCGGFGHIRKDCPSREKDTPTRRKPIEEVICYSCGLKGHYANNCPSKVEEEEDKEEENKKATPGKVMNTKVRFQTNKGATNAVTAVQATAK